MTAGASAQGAFSAIGQTQLLMLLPEVGVYMPSLVGETLSNLDELMFSFNFLSLDSTPMYTELEGTFGYSKHNSTRNLGIIQSGSSFLNLFHFLVVFLIIVFTHIIVLIFKIILGQRKEENTLDRWVSIIYNFMTFTVYIKFIMLTYLFLLFAAFYEIHVWTKGYSGKTYSRMFAIFITFFCFSTLAYAIYYWVSSPSTPKDNVEENQKKKENVSEKEAKPKKCRACFSGLKDSKSKRIHIVMFFVRRILLSSLVFLLSSWSIMTKLGIFTGIQALYL